MKTLLLVTGLCGLATLAQAQNVVKATQLDLGSAGVRFTQDGDGALTLLGRGNGSDEAFTFNLDDTANTISITSSTGVTLWDFGTIGLTSSGTIAAGTLTGAGGGVTLTASGFDGNLAVTDNTLQEIAQKFDDFSAGIGDLDALTAATEADLATTDVFAVSDGGTEKKITLENLVDTLEAQTWTFTSMDVTTLDATTLEIANVAVTSTAAELNYTDGVTSAIQTQLNTKITASSTDTLTNKTLDASATGNVLKQFGYLVLTHPHVFGSGVTQQTTVTANTYGQALFANATDKATNYVEYYCVIPPDIDTAVDLTATLKFKLGGADTNDHEYEITFDSVAASAPAAGTLADAISLAYTADASGADNDSEQAGETTLTGWRSAMTAGNLMVIRVARDGDHASDTSTVNSYSGPLVIKYGITQ